MIQMTLRCLQRTTFSQISRFYYPPQNTLQPTSSIQHFSLQIEKQKVNNIECTFLLGPKLKKVVEKEKAEGLERASIQCRNVIIPLIVIQRAFIVDVLLRGLRRCLEARNKTLGDDDACRAILLPCPSSFCLWIMSRMSRKRMARIFHGHTIPRKSSDE